MRRRHFLLGLGGTLGGLCGAATLGNGLGCSLALAAAPQQERMVQHLPALPILMFHKVDDKPRYPEDIATTQLVALLDLMWKEGFCPVNMSDILENRVDDIVPKGLKPIGITADDAHYSVVFSQTTAKHGEPRNARSLVEVLAQSLAPFGHAPRATFFLSGVGDDRYSSKAGGYFGNSLPLSDVLDALAVMPGVETGYHTLHHTKMGGLSGAQVRALAQEQMRDFEKLGVLHRVQRILAYPYGVRASEEGRNELRDLGFKGAVLAYPGVREARYDDLPSCVYDGQLMTDAFLIPRVCIGAYTYAHKVAATGGAHVPIDPLDDFRKDVLKALPQIYVSAGPRTPQPS